MRALTNESLDDYANAINDYSSLLELDQKNWDAYKKRGIAKRKIKDFEGAINDFSRVIKLNLKNQREFIYLRVETKELSKDYTGAINDYSKLIEIDHENYDAYNKRGIAKRKNKDLKGAVEDFTEAIKSNPYNTDLLFNRGELYFEESKDYKNAIQDFSKILEINPHFGKVYLLRGLSYYELNQYSNSLRDFRESKKYNPTYEVFYDEQKLQDLVKEEIYRQASKGISNEGEYLSNKERKELFRKLNKVKIRKSRDEKVESEFRKSRDKKDESEFKKEEKTNNNYQLNLKKNEEETQSFIDRKFKSAILGVSDSGKYLSKEERINLFKQNRDNAKTTEIISDLKSTGIYSFTKNELINKIKSSFDNKKESNYTNNYSTNTKSSQKYNKQKTETKKSYFENGYLFYQSKYYEKAIEEFSKEISINPNNQQAYFYRSYAKYEIQDFEGANEDYSKAIDLNDEIKKTYNHSQNNFSSNSNNKDDYYKQIRFKFGFEEYKTLFYISIMLAIIILIRLFQSS